jgi:hypothetical protein
MTSPNTLIAFINARSEKRDPAQPRVTSVKLIPAIVRRAA